LFYFSDRLTLLQNFAQGLGFRRHGPEVVVHLVIDYKID
jgi:hypothetical protein